MTKTKVLIIEDEIEILSTLEFFLTRQNFEVYKAQNGLEALTILSKELPDVILLDGHMPIMNGKEFLNKRKAEKLGQDIPVIFISSHDWNLENDSRIHYLSKPFDYKNILSLINQAIKNEEEAT